MLVKSVHGLKDVTCNDRMQEETDVYTAINRVTHMASRNETPLFIF